MRIDRRTFVLAGVAVSTAACADSTAPPEPSATVMVERQTLAVAMVPAGSVTWIQFTVPVRIHNTGSGPLRFVICASRLEAQGGDQWNAVWAPVCLAESAMAPEIPAGESRAFAVSVWASVQGSGSPAWRATGTDGTYRFVAGVVRSGVGGVIPTVASNGFTLASGS